VGQLIARSGFRGLAHWVTDPYAGDTPRPAIFASGVAAGIDSYAEDPGEAEDPLDGELTAIADEVHRHAAAARAGAVADFAAQVAHARKHFRPPLLAAVLAAIKQQREAVLALINRNAAAELTARRKMVKMKFRSRRRRSRHQLNRQNGPTASPVPH
jgi:hypothetical protein